MLESQNVEAGKPAGTRILRSYIGGALDKNAESFESPCSGRCTHDCGHWHGCTAGQLPVTDRLHAQQSRSDVPQLSIQKSAQQARKASTCTQVTLRSPTKQGKVPHFGCKPPNQQMTVLRSAYGSLSLSLSTRLGGRGESSPSPARARICWSCQVFKVSLRVSPVELGCTSLCTGSGFLELHEPLHTVRTKQTPCKQPPALRR